MNYNVLKKIFPIENCTNFKKLKYDSEGLWSISHPDIANKLSKKIKLFEKSGIKINTILDATAGLGGNTISFAKYFNKVISIEYDKGRFDILKNNVNNYNYQNIILYNGDSIKLLLEMQEKIDAVFLDPPWGGPNYKYDDNLTITMSNKNLDEICHIIESYSYQNNKVQMIILKLPYNYDYNKLIENCKKFVKIYNLHKEGNINYLILLISSN